MAENINPAFELPAELPPLTREELVSLEKGELIGFVEESHRSRGVRTYWEVAEPSSPQGEGQMLLRRPVTDGTRLKEVLIKAYKMAGALDRYPEVAASRGELFEKILVGYQPDPDSRDASISLQHWDSIDYDRLVAQSVELTDSKYSKIERLQIAKDLIGWWKSFGQRILEETARLVKDAPESGDAQVEAQAEAANILFIKDLVEAHIERTIAHLNLSDEEVGWTGTPVKDELVDIAPEEVSPPALGSQVAFADSIGKPEQGTNAGLGEKQRPEDAGDFEITGPPTVSEQGAAVDERTRQEIDRINSMSVGPGIFRGDGGLADEVRGGVESGDERARQEAGGFVNESLLRPLKRGFEIGREKLESGGALVGKVFEKIRRQAGLENIANLHEMEDRLGSEVTSKIYERLQELYDTHYTPVSWKGWGAVAKRQYEQGLEKALRADYAAAIRDSYQMLEGGVIDDLVDMGQFRRGDSVGRLSQVLDWEAADTGEVLPGEMSVDASRLALRKQIKNLSESQGRSVTEKTTRSNEIAAELRGIEDEMAELTAEARLAGEAESLEKIARLQRYIQEIDAGKNSPVEMQARLEELRAERTGLQRKLRLVRDALKPPTEQLWNPVRLEEAWQQLVDQGIISQGEFDEALVSMRTVAEDLKSGDATFGQRLDEISHLYLSDADKDVKVLRGLISRNPDIRNRSLRLDGSSRLDGQVYLAIMDNIWGGWMRVAGLNEVLETSERELAAVADAIKYGEKAVTTNESRDTKAIPADLSAELEQLRRDAQKAEFQTKAGWRLGDFQTRMEALQQRRRELQQESEELKQPFTFDLAGSYLKGAGEILEGREPRVADADFLVTWNGHLRSLHARLAYREKHFEEQDKSMRDGDKQLVRVLKRNMPETVEQVQAEWPWQFGRATYEKANVVWKSIHELIERDILQKRDHLAELKNHKKWVELLDTTPEENAERMLALKASAERLAKTDRERAEWTDASKKYWEAELRGLFGGAEISDDQRLALASWVQNLESVPASWVQDPAQPELPVKPAAKLIEEFEKSHEALSAEIFAAIESLERDDLRQRAELAQKMLEAIYLFRASQAAKSGFVDETSMNMSQFNIALERIGRWKSSDIGYGLLNFLRNPAVAAAVLGISLGYGLAETAMESSAVDASNPGRAIAVERIVQQPRKEIPSIALYPEGFERFGEAGEQYMRNFRQIGAMNERGERDLPVIDENIRLLQQIRSGAEGNPSDLIEIDQQIALNETWKKIIDAYREQRDDAA